MIQRPKFKEHLRADVVSPDRLILRAEWGETEIQGRIFALLAPLLDGQHRFSDIVDKVHHEANVLDVAYGISLLEEQGHIAEAKAPTAFSAIAGLLGINAEEVDRRLKNTRVRVFSFGDISPQDFIARLTSLNIKVDDDGDQWVALTDGYLQPGLAELDREAERLQRSWMLIKPVGAVLWFGPILLPGRSPCFECLTRRLEEAAPPAPLSHLPSIFHSGLNMAATQVFARIAGCDRAHLEDRLLTWDALSMETASHAIRQHPRCSRCRRVLGHESPKPLRLETRPKMFTSDGGHRAVSPEATLEKLRVHISPITGIVPNLHFRRMDSNGLGQVFVADWPSSSTAPGAFRFPLRNKCAGKGVSRVQAQVSALCEALERYSGIFQNNEFRRSAPFTALRGEAIHLNACTNFSERQYAQRANWNAGHPPALRVPEPFDEEAEIEWTPLWSLTEEKFKYLPTAYCYFGYPAAWGRAFCGADSNGNAAGNTIEEAILQGFMEVVERDCAAIWWYSRSRRPAVDLQSFDHPYLRGLRNYYSSIGREVWVLDITSDLNIPAFAAISREHGEDGREILGFGAHFSAELAIMRALTELSQFLPAASDSTLKRSGAMAAPLLHNTWLTPGKDIRLRKCEDFPDASSNDLCEDVVRCVQVAKHRGLETLVLDQTRPEIGLHVVKVVVPGLRSWWARFGPGRLYTVPVLLGWREQEQLEDDLNPRHILF